MPPKIKAVDLIYGDAFVLADRGHSVAPPISVTTTFHADPALESEEGLDFANPPFHVYSRYTQDISTRAEHILAWFCGNLCVWAGFRVCGAGPPEADIQYYADKIHKVGGKLLVDSTYAPPPLQYPFNFGADIIMYSAIKYLGGHSDLLAGVLVVKTQEEWHTLHHDRIWAMSWALWTLGYS